MRDMTSGSPLKLILRFAFPLLMGNIPGQWVRDCRYKGISSADGKHSPATKDISCFSFRSKVWFHGCLLCGSHSVDCCGSVYCSGMPVYDS